MCCWFPLQGSVRARRSNPLGNSGWERSTLRWHRTAPPRPRCWMCSSPATRSKPTTQQNLSNTTPSPWPRVSSGCCCRAMTWSFFQYSRTFMTTRKFSESRRTSKSVDIINPQLNIIAGTQPGYLASLFPEEAWSMGFMSRVIMVYSGSAPRLGLFDDYAHLTTDSLLTGLKQMVMTNAECGWAHSAQVELSRWYEQGLPPIPSHSRRSNYCARTLVHVFKLAIICTVSRKNGSGNPLVITLFDVDRARNWLLAAEQVMPDVFRAMAGKSDMTLLLEMHFYFWRRYVTDKKPIHESELIRFISAKTTSERGPRLLDIAVRIDMFAKVPGTDLYTPRPHSDFGME